MGQPYVGEIRMVGWTYAAAGWAFTNGQLMAISQNPTLFNLIGTTYGGDGQNTFALPDIRGRFPMHAGTGAQLSGRVIGQMGGSEMTNFPLTQIPGAPVAPITALTYPIGQVSISPLLVINFIISLFGVFPSQT